jgi:hypothetical protein
MKPGMHFIPLETNPPSYIFITIDNTKMAAVVTNASTYHKRTYIFCMLKIINMRICGNSEFMSYNFHIEQVYISGH